MKFLYAGDSPLGGPANYLLGILKAIKADVRHIAPSQTLKASLLKPRYDAVILSDFSRDHMPRDAEEVLVKQVKTGMGLIMIGGWGSFAGPFGKWKGSCVERLLPVNCLGRDDRINFPGGALVLGKTRHPVLNLKDLKNPPVIAGLNKIMAKKNARVILSARKITARPKASGRFYSLALDSGEYPLLVVDCDPRTKIAALATDLAPHWCGGLLDWGRKRVQIQVTQRIRIEVGDGYVRFVSALLRWLAGG